MKQTFYVFFYILKRNKKKDSQQCESITWQFAIFTRAGLAIFAVKVLNFCVRNGNRCVHFAIITRSFEGLIDPSKLNNSQLLDLISLQFGVIKSSTYQYWSTPRITTLPSPAYQPDRLSGVLLLSNGKSHLGVGFALRCLQRLSFPYLATQLCRWHDNWCTRGRSIPVLSY